MSRRKRTNPKGDGQQGSKGSSKEYGKFAGKGPQREREEGFTQDREYSSNDWRWYAANPSLLNGANLPFNYAAGTTLRLQYPISGNVTTIGSDQSLNGNYVFGGLMTEEVIPSVGLSLTSNSPINIAAFQLWVKTRKNKASYSPYNAVAEMLYVRAMADVYSYITYLMRVYGMATSMFNQSNRFQPRLLLEANGVDPDVSKTELAQFRYGINLMITQAASFTVPADLPIFTRAAFMYQNIYKEGTSSKDQMYMYTPYSFLQLAWDDDPGNDDPTSKPPVYLKQVPFMYDASGNRNSYTLAELLDYGQALIRPLIGNEDINMMGADILAAFEGNIIKLTSLSEDYPIEPFFDIAVLEQMKNATILTSQNLTASVNAWLRSGTWDITESANAEYIQCNPQVDTRSAVTNNATEQARRLIMQAGRILTTTTADVGPELVLESTRLMLAFKQIVPGQNYNLALIHASEVVAGCYFWSYEPGTTTAVITPWHGIQRFFTGNDALTSGQLNANQGTIASLVESTMFRFKPCAILITLNSGSTDGLKATDVLFDVDNYTAVHPSDLERVHETALLSLYGVQ